MYHFRCSIYERIKRKALKVNINRDHGGLQARPWRGRDTGDSSEDFTRKISEREQN